MIKGKLKCSSIILFVVILIVSCIMTVFATEKPITLTLAMYQYPPGLGGVNIEILKDELTKKTDGKVELKVYWGGSLLKGKEILRGVADGTVDMGQLNPNYYPNILPLNGAYAVVPMGPNKYNNKVGVFNTGMEQIPEMKAEFTTNNQIPLYIYVLLPKVSASTKPITCLKDFKGKKMRASSRWLLSMLGGAGATPVSVPWIDCYMALQTGTIDAVLTNLDGIHDSKLDEVAPHVFLCPQIWNTSPNMISMNIDSWNKIPEDIQEQIMDAMKSTSIRYGEAYDKDWEKIVAEQKEMGCVINAMTPEDAKIWGNLPILEEIEAKWIKENKERGVKDPAGILKQIKEIVKEGVKREREEEK